MRVIRRIVLTLLTKVLYEFDCFKEKVHHFKNFGPGNAAILRSCPETNLHASKVVLIFKIRRVRLKN